MMKKITGFEQSFIFNNEVMEFAVRVNNSKAIPKIINNIVKSTIGFRLKIEGENLVLHHDKFDVQKIPNNINDPYNACLYGKTHFSPVFSKSLATIAANDNIVSVCASHSIADGAFFKNLLPKIYDDGIEMVDNLPVAPYNLFIDEASRFDSVKPLVDISRLTQIPKSFSVPDNDPSLKYRRDIVDEIPINELKCYGKSKNRVVGLTDSLWLSVALSAASTCVSNEPPKVGCLTCVDMRQFMKPQQKTNRASNCFSIINVLVDNINRNMKIGEAKRSIRQNFNNIIKSNKIFSVVKAWYDNFDDIKGIAPIISNIGPMHFYSPIDDFYIMQSYKSKPGEGIMDFISFSKVGNGKNIVNNRFQYSPTGLSDELAHKIFKSINYFLRYIPDHATIQEAVNELSKI